MNRRLRTALGVALSVLFLWWAFRGVSFGELLRGLRAADPGLFLLGVVINIAGLAIRALRWGVLLHPLGVPVPFRPRFASVIIGFAASNVLPARLGEVARAVTLARITPVGTGASFASLVVERIFDAIAVIGFLFLAMGMPGFPAAPEIGGVDPRVAARGLAPSLGVLALILLAMVMAPAPFVRAVGRVTGLLPRRIGTPLQGAFQSFLAGLGVLRSAPLFLASLGLALFQWWFTAWSFLVTMRAFGIDQIPFTGALFVQSLLSLAVALPAAPGFVGVFEGAAVLGVGLWGVTREQGLPFAIALHLGGLVPVTLMGFYYLMRLNLSLRDVRTSEQPSGGGGTEER